MNLRSRKRHSDHVNALKEKLRSYGVNPFASTPLRNVSTGEEIEEAIVHDMINAEVIGNAKFTEFVCTRLVHGEKDFFHLIKKTNLCTGMKKKKVIPKAVALLKEDCQAFGLIVSKAISIEKAFTYPITSVPLALATTECGLR